MYVRKREFDIEETRMVEFFTFGRERRSIYLNDWIMDLESAIYEYRKKYRDPPAAVIINKGLYFLFERYLTIDGIKIIYSPAVDDEVIVV